MDSEENHTVFSRNLFSFIVEDEGGGRDQGAAKSGTNLLSYELVFPASNLRITEYSQLTKWNNQDVFRHKWYTNVTYSETLGLFHLKNKTLQVEDPFALNFLILHLQKGVPCLTFHLQELEGRKEEKRRRLYTWHKEI